MWKKWLTALLALALCLTGAALAEEDEIWVQDASLVTRADGTLLLHLMLGKAGGPLQLDDVGVAFLDAAGQSSPMASVGLYSAAVLALPEGEYYFPVTLMGVPAEGANAVTDFRVTGLYTSVPAAGTTAYIEPAAGFFLMKGPEHDEVTAFTDAWAGEDPSVYAGYAFVYDRAGRYLGNVLLPLGSGGFVAGENMLSTLAQVIRWKEGELLKAGFPQRAPDCILFGAIPMDGLPEAAAPGGAEVFVCATPLPEEKTLVIVDFTLDAADGAFTIHATAKNTSDIPVRLTGVPYVALHDEAGKVFLCTEVTLHAPECVFAPGESRAFTLTGALAEGFVPVACGFVTDCVPESTK